VNFIYFFADWFCACAAWTALSARLIYAVGEISDKQVGLRSGMSGEAIFAGPSS